MREKRQLETNEKEADKFFVSDLMFDKLIPLEYREQSAKHFTPIEVGIKAANFLAEATKNPHTLDVGAGLGKFCAIAGHFTHTKITGIEQRPALVTAGNKILTYLGITNVDLKVENMTQTKFEKYSGIYFYNSFYENIDHKTLPIDATIEYSTSLYRFYTDLLYKKLKEMPVYTRLATYHATPEHIPENYTELESFFAGNLKLWIKYD